VAIAEHVEKKTDPSGRAEHLQRWQSDSASRIS